MDRSSISDALFGIPAQPLSRAERIEIIKQSIRDESFLSQERLDAALERMLEEIRSG